MRATLLPLLLLSAACAAVRPPAPPPPPADAGSEIPGMARILVQRAHLRIVVDDPAPVAPRARELAEALGGYVESSTAEEARVTLVMRVPADRLQEYLGTAQQWGRVRETRVTAEDVTEQSVDLEARVRNLASVRDRLRLHLDAATGTQDVIAVERELGRVQAELEMLEGRLARLRTDVGHSRVTLEVERRLVLGPLGALFVGLAQLLGKLFVIR